MTNRKADRMTIRVLEARWAMAIAALALVTAAGCARQAAAPAGAQRVAIKVTDQGFEPAVVTVHVGQPVTLLVTRTTDQTCATELVMKGEHIHQALPLDREVAITFTPTQQGDLDYACGMDMIKGTVRVE